MGYCGNCKHIVAIDTEMGVVCEVDGRTHRAYDRCTNCEPFGCEDWVFPNATKIIFESMQRIGDKDADSDTDSDDI